MNEETQDQNIDSFDEIAREQAGQEMPLPKQSNRQQLESQVSKVTLHKRQKKAEKTIKLLGGATLGWAKNSPLARQYFEREVFGKPIWAVVCLVALRDGGVCWICKENVGAKPNVRRLSRVAPWVETNCVALCDNCDKVWVEKDYVTGAILGLDTRTVQEALDKLKLMVMNRRNGKVGLRRGAKPLGEVGSRQWLKVFRGERRYKDKQRVVGQEVLRRMREIGKSEIEILEELEEGGAKQAEDTNREDTSQEDTGKEDINQENSM